MHVKCKTRKPEGPSCIVVPCAPTNEILEVWNQVRVFAGWNPPRKSYFFPSHLGSQKLPFLPCVNACGCAGHSPMVLHSLLGLSGSRGGGSGLVDGAGLPVDHPGGARLPQGEPSRGACGGFRIHGAGLTPADLLPSSQRTESSGRKAKQGGGSGG